MRSRSVMPSRPVPNISSLVGVPKAAEKSGLDPSTIRRHIKNGRLKAYRLGPRLIKIDPAELDKLIEPIGGES